jgi:hypothetical protein
MSRRAFSMRSSLSASAIGTIREVKEDAVDGGAGDPAALFSPLPGAAHDPNTQADATAPADAFRNSRLGRLIGFLLPFQYKKWLVGLDIPVKCST